MSWFPTALAEHGDRPALVTTDAVVSYAELAERVAVVGERLGEPRRLVLLGAANQADAIVAYLAALAGRHPAIVVGADAEHAIRALVDAYDPDVVVRPGTADPPRWEIDERRPSSRHDLHPDLALLLSTSGSTGSPKLVRLSRRNLQANAEQIAAVLGVTDADRAMTSLPMAYCYGLSVINSHLLRGASVVLTDRSVIDPGFWDLARRSQATSFAGVPYTFDLLDRAGFAGMSLPHLRAVTQAGGRLTPDRVRAYAQLGERRGWRLFVMYGQTEATARMACLPPHLAAQHPESVGVPVPGGSVRLDPVADAGPGVGELVYRGPNVMLGYAEGPSDLARGATVDELHTGDLARRTAGGLLEIVGRRAAFVKIAGLRVDPGMIERLAASHGARATVVGTDEALTVFVEGVAPPDLGARIRGRVCLPAQAVRVRAVAELPRLPSGKVDRTALRALAEQPLEGKDPAPADAEAALRHLYASTLGVTHVTPRASFASLGGDSLSYVAITLGIEEILGRLPERWETMSIGDLAAIAGGRSPQSGPGRLGRWQSVEMSVALRAVAIVLIVATHIGMTTVAGGAHVLMAVAGYNFARFRLTAVSRRDRVRSQLRAVARIALPTMAWVAAMMVLLDQYELRHLFLVNALVRDELWGNLWFIELLVYIGLTMAALLALPAVDRAERRWPFGAALTVLGVGLLLRFAVVDLPVPYTMPVLWLFAIGWAASRARRPWQRAAVAAITLVSVPGYFESPERNLAILVGVLLLVGVPRIVVPAAIARIGGMLAGASLSIYLVHWEVWPLFNGWYGVPSLLASLAAGVGLSVVLSRAIAHLERARPGRVVEGAFDRLTALRGVAGRRTAGMAGR
jgi:acyl-CoA synthetase (AMP-forming)/AMP-acid ligase II/peptidoglycan/LPS O-acetylase OafA/YrhL